MVRLVFFIPVIGGLRANFYAESAFAVSIYVTRLTLRIVEW